MAVDGLDLEIKRNSFTGLLGPNGAGKSTTLKILTHLINATSGSALLNGIDVTKDPKRALTGVGTVVETPEFYGYLTPRQTLRYIGEIIGMNNEARVSQTEAILEKVKMTDWGDKKIQTFSKGMRQRIALGQALLDDPSIIILDEPTSGLDPRGMAEIRAVLKDLRNQSNNLTIVMSSHMLYEVSDLCDRVALINHGKLLIHDDIGVITAEEGTRRMRIRLIRTPEESDLKAVSSLENVIEAQRVGNEIDAMVKGDDAVLAHFFESLAGLNIGVYGVSEEDSLEAKYLSLIKESA